MTSGPAGAEEPGPVPLLVPRETVAGLGRLDVRVPGREVLRAGQVSKRALLVTALGRLARERVPQEARRAGLLDALAELEWLSSADPAACERVLLHPFLDAWAAGCLKRLSRGTSETAELDYLAEVMLPIRLGAPLPDASVPRLEDRDRQRDQYGRAPSRPLAGRERARWQENLTRAGALLAHTGLDPVIAENVAAVVPLRGGPFERTVSASARRTYRAIGVCLPQRPDPARQLALLLVHEALHVRLWALLDLVPLCMPDDRRRLPVPWRPDLRPPQAALHGAYAHLGMAMLWRAWRDAAPDEEGRARAQQEYARLRRGVASVLEELRRCGALTGPGDTFAGGMAERLAAHSGPSAQPLRS
jgi:hypothetical protein